MQGKFYFGEIKIWDPLSKDQFTKQRKFQKLLKAIKELWKKYMIVIEIIFTI